MKFTKKFIFILIFIFTISFGLVACDDNTDSPDVIFEIDEFEGTTFMLGDQVFFSVTDSTNSSNILWESSDENIAFVDEFGIVDCLGIGKVTITATSADDSSIKDSIELTITEKHVSNITIYGVTSGKVGDVLEFTYKLEPKDIDSELYWECDNTDLAEVKQDGTVKLLNEGVVNISVKALDSGNFTKTFMIGIFAYDEIIVDSEKTYTQGEAIEFEGKTYYAGYTYLNSLRTACTYASENATIKVLKGHYDEYIAINTNGVKIYGVNHKNGSFEAEDKDDSIFAGTILIGTDIKDVEIKGMTFIDKATITLYEHNVNILIANNKFLNSKSDNTDSWKEDEGDACIKLLPSDVECDSVTIINNYFYNIQVHGIALSAYKNLKITNNVFENFKLDAIREYYGESLSAGQLLIRNNKFIEGECNAIYFNVFGAAAVTYEKIIAIYDNEFKKVGSEIDGVEHYAIKFSGFNGGTVSVSVKYNTFDSCINNVKFEESDKPKLNKYVYSYINYNLFKTDNLNYLVNNEMSGTTVNLDLNTYIKSNGDEISNVNYFVSGSTNPEEGKITKEKLDNTVKIYGKNNLNIGSETTYIIEDREVSWSCSNVYFVKIDTKGNAKGVAVGTSILRAYENGVEIAQITVHVSESLNVDYASRLVEVALGEEGYVEGSNNYTKYGEWYVQFSDPSFAHGAWCAMFVSWCADQANISTTIVPLYASCKAGQQWFIQRGLFQARGSDYTPKTGDIIFFASDGVNPSHTGIVVDSFGGKVYTIEGNTSNMCAQRSYDLNKSTITGYGTPNYPAYTGEKIQFDVSSSTDGSNASTQ